MSLTGKFNVLGRIQKSTKKNSVPVEKQVMVMNLLLLYLTKQIY